jgi:Zn-dependent protease with chaperone function/type II secretory pathway pseudopilin PulG
MALDPRYVSSKEKPLFVIGAIFSALAWLGLIVSIIGLLYALLGALFVLAALALFLAHVRNNGVRVDERQLPELHARVKAAAARLGIAELPAIYVIQGGGLLNAFATKLLSRRYVVILSDLVDHCEDPRQLDFVVGHELGHFAASHLKWNLFLLPFRIVPWLGAAYSRACEYTCDRCGLAAAGDLEQAMRGLVVLSAGGRIAAKVDLAAFASQREESGGFWSTVLELTSSHPFLSKRVAALQELHAPGTVKPVRRSVAGWILAPAFGALSGGAGAAPMVAVAMIGILAAIAIPNFIRFQLRAKDQAARTELANLFQAQVAAQARDGKFAELQLPAQAPGAAKTLWSPSELEAARKLDWAVQGGGYHAYTVSVAETEDGRQAFAACAESDLDGDGTYAAWMIWLPLEDEEGDLIAPASPCRFNPVLSRDAIFGADDQPGVPVRVSPAEVF